MQSWLTTADAGRPRRCESCGEVFTLVLGRGGKPPSLVFDRTSGPPPAPRAPAAAGGVHTVMCSCGNPLKYLAEHLGKQVQCGACRKVMRLEKVTDPQSLTTRIRLKVQQRSDTGAFRTMVRMSISCACGRQLLVRREDVGRQAECHGCGRLMRLEVRRDPQSMKEHVVGVELEQPDRKEVQELLCECGAPMLVGPGDLGKEVQCPGCGATMKLKRVRDASSGDTTIRVKRVDPPPDRAMDDWSLDDFS